MKKLLHAVVVLIVFSFGSSSVVNAQSLQEQFSKKVTEFTLDNGLKFIVIERHEAPVASFYTYADVGSVDEVKGITGIAHMFEHMAFKGTTTINTTDIDKEREAMSKVDEIIDVYQREKQRGANADSSRLSELAAALDSAMEEAQEHVVQGEFEQAIERNGGTGLNASTSWDATDYFYSLASNKVELWFSLEADRFLNPVLREFYTERDVIAEERRMRTESNPFGRLMEEFFSTAFKAHPYGEPTIGHMSDIQNYTREQALQFFEKYYNAANLTIAIAGDVDPKEVQRLAEKYFGRLPKGVKPNKVRTTEPKQIGERRVTIEDQSQPILLAGWHKGSVNHPDDPIFDMLADVLDGGRTSRFYKTLIEKDKIAVQTQALNSFPGFNKYPNLFLILGVTSPGYTATDLETAMYAVIDDVIENGVTDDELRRAKTRARANLIRGLQSNTGIAQQLAYYEVVTGSWENLFARLDRLEGVTSADIQRVARETLTKNNRTVALIQTKGGNDTDATATTNNSGEESGSTQDDR